MWTATKLSEDAASKMQVNAGLLLNTFDIKNPIEPLDSHIICETTGDYSISCVPTTEDFFGDVNNAPNNTKEGKRITGWDCSLGVTALSVTEEMLKLSLGASDVNDDGGITPREQYTAEDFKSVYWIGDGAFSDCKNLDGIEIRENINAIPAKMFQGCVNLKKIKLHEQLSGIGDYAFADCANLETIYIPDSVTAIGENAFEGVNEKFILMCSFGSYAENYARKKKLKYQFV